MTKRINEKRIDIIPPYKKYIYDMLQIALKNMFVKYSWENIQTNSNTES